MYGTAVNIFLEKSIEDGEIARGKNVTLFTFCFSGDAVLLLYFFISGL